MCGSGSVMVERMAAAPSCRLGYGSLSCAAPQNRGVAVLPRLALAQSTKKKQRCTKRRQQTPPPSQLIHAQQHHNRPGCYEYIFLASAVLSSCRRVSRLVDVSQRDQQQ